MKQQIDKKKYEEEDLLLRKKWNNDFENGKIPLGKEGLGLEVR